MKQRPSGSSLTKAVKSSFLLFDIFFYGLVFRFLSVIAQAHSSFPVSMDMTSFSFLFPLEFEGSDEMTGREAASVFCFCI